MRAFVGRRRQLEMLAGGLDEALTGRGGLFLVAGEPGIGKTSLVEQLEPLLEDRAVSLAWGRCSPEGGPPLWPWREVLTAIGSHELARAMAEPASGGESARFRLFDAVLAALTAQRLVVALDDLQWADPDTIDVLRFVGRRLRSAPLLVLGTFRDTEVDPQGPLTALLGELTALGHLVKLTGLTVDEVAGLAARAGGDVDPERLHRRSGGNPFLIDELLRGGLSSPAGADAVIRRRLQQLPEACVHLIEAAAMMGRSFDTISLAAIADAPAWEVGDALTAASSAGLVLLHEGGSGEFVHDVVREVVVASLSAPRRSEWNWRIGEHLRQGEPDRLDAAACRLRAGVGSGDRAVAVSVSLTAARRAVQLLAFRLAAEHFEAALDLGADKCPTLLELGEARLLGGDWDGAGDAFSDAFTIALEAGRVDDAARAALGFGAGLGGFEVRGFDNRQVGVLQRAERVLRGTDSPLTPLILARLAVARSLSGAAEERLALTTRAVAVADVIGDPVTMAATRAAHCDSIAGPDHIDSRRGLAAEIVELSGRTGNDELRLLGHRFAIVVALEAGDFASADRCIAEFTVLAEQYRLPLVRWYVPLFAGMRALLRGDLDRADALAVAARTIGEEAGSDNAAMLSDSLVLAVQRQRGGLGDLAEQLEAVLAPYLTHSPILLGPWACRAALAVDCSDPALARSVLDAALAADFRSDDRDSEWLGSLAFLTEAAVFTDHRIAAQRLRQLLEPYGHRWVVDGIGAACLGSVAEFLARLCHLLDDVDAARHWADRAEAGYQRVGAPLLLERLRHELRSTRPAAPPRPAFQREGQLWRLRWQGTEVHLPDAKGLCDIAVLLARPGCEVHVGELAGSVAGSPLPVLDEEARQSYRRRWAEIDADIDAADAAGDVRRAELCRLERDALFKTLSAATGLGGRVREVPGPHERARQAVRARIRHSLDRIERCHPEMARHLRRSIRTGTFCCYDPDHAVDWQVEPLTM